jgi:hypothetical protein
MSPKNIKYLFCISTGRCGTDYLSKLLATLNGCSSFHEQKPRMHKGEMREYLKGNKAPIQALMPHKMAKINLHTGLLYSDTTHVFIKSFGWEIPKYIPQEEIGIIILKREIDKVAESTHRTQSGPFNDLGRDWIIYPNGNNIVRPPVIENVYKLMRLSLKLFWRLKGYTGYKKYPLFFKKQSIKLIKWYYQETYALAENYKNTFPNIHFIEIQLEEINTLEGFEKIINAFELQQYYNRDDTYKLIGKPVNLKVIN